MAKATKSTKKTSKKDSVPEGKVRAQVTVDEDIMNLAKRVFANKHGRHITFNLGDYISEVVEEEATKQGLVDGSFYSSYSKAVQATFRLNNLLTSFIGSVNHVIGSEQRAGKQLEGMAPAQEDEPQPTNEQVTQALEDLDNLELQPAA